MTPEEAKLLAAGPLGQEMAKFAPRFCAPVYFGPAPSRQHPAVLNNGTASLLKVRGEFCALTCSHVIDGYRLQLAKDNRCMFAIANCYLKSPLDQILIEDAITDVAVLVITPEQAANVTRESNGIGEAFFETGAERPSPVQIDDYVAYAGFPGCFRRVVSFNELNFGSYSSGACRVIEIYSDYMMCGFERDFWIRNSSEPEPESLGGLSGGPVFAIRYRPSGLVSYEFAGLIYRMHESTESLFVRQAGALPIHW